MNQSSKIIELAKNNNGIVTNEMVVNNGLSRGLLKYLVDNNKLEKTSRGVYILPEVFEDEFINLQTKFKKGIFSLDTALYLCDLTDRTPNKFYMTFPNNYNLTGPKKEGVICNSIKKELHEIGVIEKTTPNGNKVRSYNAERTLCDILKTRNNVDIQVVTDAFKIYVETDDKNIPLLSEYSKELNVEKRLRPYLEVLL